MTARAQTPAQRCHPGSLCTIMIWLHLYHHTHIYAENLFCKLAAMAAESCDSWLIIVQN